MRFFHLWLNLPYRGTVEMNELYRLLYIVHIGGAGFYLAVKCLTAERSIASKFSATFKNR